MWFADHNFKLREKVEGREKNSVHGDGKNEPRVEHPREQLIVELQVHEVAHNDDELDSHHHEQRRKEKVTKIHVIGGDFKGRNRGKDCCDADVAGIRHAVFSC